MGRNQVEIHQGSCTKGDMAQKQSLGLPFAVLFLACIGASLSVSATAQAVHRGDEGTVAPGLGSRLAGDWRNSEAVVIPASKPPAPQHSSSSRSAAPANARLERMVLLLKPSPTRQSALTAELANQQNPSSPRYHEWLTPTAFADAYSNSAEDVSAVSAWLENRGFEVSALPAGRGWIEFSGTVAQVEQAFQTRVDSVLTSDGLRLALSEGISIPAALAPLVQGLVSLDGVLSMPALTQPQAVSVTAAELASQTASQTLPSRAEALTPQLAAQLLHFDALHKSGLTGAGESIAIAARSNVRESDVADFRAAFGLPASALKILPNGTDPGLAPDQTKDQAEATMAASWVGAAAPAAQIVLVPAATTAATDGLDLALAAIVDQKLANIVAVGYSTCEAALTPAHQAFYAALYRQAAAEGISVIAAAGDSGPSACHPAGSADPVSTGYGVNALASTPWNTAVGVAAFGASTEAFSAWSPASAADPAFVGGGGSSTLYSAPAWQPTPSQLPQGADTPETHNRLLPDLALPTAIDSNDNPRSNPGLAFCLGVTGTSNGCTLVRAGGSSASAALFAGIAALVDEKNGPQGNLAPHLYSLSHQSGIFTDVEQGSARLACSPGSPGCEADGQIGFTAAAGYDLTTGLGVVDADGLVSRWATPETTGTAAVDVNLSISPTEPNSTYNPSASITFTASVFPVSGSVAPTGTVSFVDTTEAQPLSLTPSALSSSGTATLTVVGPFGSGGNEIVAIYSGDANYASASSSPPVNVNIQPSTTSIAVVPSSTSVAEGATISVTATLTVVTPPEGTVPPSGLVTLNLDGLPTTSAALATANGVTSATFSLVIPAGSSVTQHALQAVYAGSGGYSASTSPAVTVTILKTATTTTVVPATTTPAAGSSLQVTATITASSSGSTGPTGTVSFTLDGVGQGTAPVTPGTSVTATLTIPVIAAGSHLLVATYSGDGNYAGSTSASVSITAAKSATITTLTATPPVLAVGHTETLTATIAPAIPLTGTVYTITGTVSFYDGGTTLLGTATITSNAATLSGVALPNNVSHSITAIYSGDPNWLASDSAALVLASTTLPDTVVLTSNYGTLSPGQSLVLTATVTPTSLPAAGAEQNPSGNIVFYNGTTVIEIVPLVATPLTDSSTATLTTATLVGGADTLSALYEGDLYYDTETSNVLVLNVEDFTIAPSPTNPGTNLNIVQGTSGSAGFAINGLGGFNNLIQIVCAVTTQDDMTCTASPQQVTPPTTVNFVIQTFLPGQQTTTASLSRGSPQRWPRAAGGTALAVLGLILLPFGRRTRMFNRRLSRRMSILLLLLVGLGTVGIGCTNVSGVNGTGTPLGVTTLKITASAYIDNTVVSHSVYQSVNVIPPGSTQ
jgi:subtilase family serine protease